MTTSYELSLRLKEFGVEQSNGEYYWVEGKLTGALYCHHKLAENKEYDWEGYEERYTILCRAFTLGELVRMLGKEIEFEVMFLNHKHGKEVFARRKNYFTGRCSRTEKEHAPEEAAGELLAAIKEQEKLKYHGEK